MSTGTRVWTLNPSIYIITGACIDKGHIFRVTSTYTLQWSLKPSLIKHISLKSEYDSVSGHFEHKITLICSAFTNFVIWVGPRLHLPKVDPPKIKVFAPYTLHC